MKHCIKCGTELRDEVKFCWECGAKVEESAQNNEVTNHNDIVKKIVNDLNMREKKICCWEICENVILHKYWDNAFSVTDLRNPSVVETMGNMQEDNTKILNHWIFYMKGMEEYQVLIHSPIWVSNVIDNKVFYINDRLEFIKCTFEFNEDGIAAGEKWEKVQYLYGPNKELRILARDNKGELTPEYYLFDEAGRIMWKADKPAKLDGYERKSGYEFCCDENYHSNNQMLVDFHTGNVIWKDVFAILFYIEKETNSLVVDCLKMLDGYDNYQHEIHDFNNGSLGPVKESFNSKEIHLPYEKYDIYRECDFKQYDKYLNSEKLKKEIKQVFVEK